jgi:hypothetical protein
VNVVLSARYMPRSKDDGADMTRMEDEVLYLLCCAFPALDCDDDCCRREEGLWRQEDRAS